MRGYKYKGMNKDYKHVMEYIKYDVTYYRAEVRFYKEAKKVSGGRKQDTTRGKIRDTAREAALDVDKILINKKKSPINILVSKAISKDTSKEK